MKSVSAQELEQKIGEVQDLAMREPVAIERDGREQFVLLSIDEYNRLLTARRSFAVEELPEWIVERVAAAEMDPQFKDLDRLLE
ncbi:MAG: type II toxin-antitoxin system Phd/YefM family antitoxin [Proteobacteria bacterium]|nr:type II toxin-antitoxin system Phd/YefM family antitoxin [Pseudomonadota bacterium]